MHHLFILTGLLLLLPSCTSVTLTDSIWCGSLGPLGATCFHSMTTDTESLTLQQWAQVWDNLDNPQVCTSASTLAEWKQDIEELCSYEQDCTVDVQEAVDTFYNKISAASQAAEKATKK